MVSDTATSILNDIQIGSRVLSSDQYGTVRYVGLVEGHPATWLGIEWDDPVRGKHDGCVSGIRYFQTSHPTSGSFVRPGKVQLGKDAVEAITSRYGQGESASEANVHQLQLLHLQKELNAPFLEMVGFDKITEKQSNFQDLQVVSLRLQTVNGPGENGKLAQLCPNIVELDLSKNLFSKWTDIFSICEQLPNLTWLNVSENLLKLPEDVENIVFPSVISLICGHMRIYWSEILTLAQIFPQLEELRVQYNLVTVLSIPSEDFLQYLKVLDLEGNNIQNWEEINKLGSLTNLEHLIISNLGIKKINLPDCESGTKLDIFPSLRQLVISENEIDNWESVGELNKLPVLEDLRFLKNPILESEKAATCIQLIVAKIENLKILNGTVIKSDERNGAEYDYIKKYGLEWFRIMKDEKLRKEFLKEHPRYLQLLEKHGTPEESELVIKAQSLKTSLTAVNIMCNDIIITKKLPATMNLQKLITLVQKLFKLSERPNLYYVSSSNPDMEIEMDDEFKDIGFYSIQNGDRIHVKLS